jgi:hypothetical protein
MSWTLSTSGGSPQWLGGYAWKVHGANTKSGTLEVAAEDLGFLRMGAEPLWGIRSYGILLQGPCLDLDGVCGILDTVTGSEQEQSQCQKRPHSAGHSDSYL